MVSRCSEGQIPGSGETSPNPVFCAMPTQPDHTSAAAGAARTSSGQDRTVRPAGQPPGTGPRRLVRRSAPGPDDAGPVPGAGRASGDGSHAGHHPSVVASGWGSPVSAASAAATSLRLART